MIERYFFYQAISSFEDAIKSLCTDPGPIDPKANFPLSFPFELFVLHGVFTCSFGGCW